VEEGDVFAIETFGNTTVGYVRRHLHLHTNRFLEIRLQIAKETDQTDEWLARAYNQMTIA
jgi:methionine aminopeptidase